MDEQIRKLRTKAIIAIVLALLALTWQFLNYLTIKELFKMDDFTSMEVIIIYSSYVFVGILFLALLSLTFTIFRVSIKFHSEKKKENKLQSDSKIDNMEEKVEL